MSRFITLALAWSLAAFAAADDAAPAASPDEPFAEQLSLGKAAEAMDQSAAAWQADHRCSQCHANFMHLIARPALGQPAQPGTDKVRELYEWLVGVRWPESGLRYPAEAMVVAVPLAFNDARLGKGLQPATEQALDRMLSLQRPDGSWQWVIGAPRSFVREFDLTMYAALGIAVAPGDYDKRPNAARALQRIRDWVAANPPDSVHAKGMLLWAACYQPGMVSAEVKRLLADDLLRVQGTDGGWSVFNLGAGAKSLETVVVDPSRASDGYGTGFAIFQARNGGIPSSDSRIQRGIEWLRTHQRASGRWFTESLNRRPNNVLSNSGTAFAILALESCGLTQ
jgi:squalene-hopene/tetraprenyl-beta-curcumene cyclase